MSEKKCPSCGAAIDLNVTECKYCGEAIVIDKSQYQQMNSEPITNTQKTNEDLSFMFLKPYYRGVFLKIETSGGSYKGGWNWCAFLFSWIWGFTKGLWILSVGTIVIALLLSAMRLQWVSLAIYIIWGAMGNYFYYNLYKNHTQLPSKL